MSVCDREREREADRGRECGIGTHGLNKGGESVCERQRECVRERDIKKNKLVREVV